MNKFVGSGRVICRGRRSRYNVFSGPKFGVDTVCLTHEATTRESRLGALEYTQPHRRCAQQAAPACQFVVVGDREHTWHPATPILPRAHYAGSCGSKDKPNQESRQPRRKWATVLQGAGAEGPVRAVPDKAAPAATSLLVRWVVTGSQREPAHQAMECAAITAVSRCNQCREGFQGARWNTLVTA